MGQTTNLITLQKKRFFLNLSNHNNKFYLLGLNFLKYFKQLLLIKNVLLINENLNYYNNKIFFMGNLYFKTVKLKNYKKKNKIINLNNTINSNLLINNIFDSIKTKFKLNLFLFNFSILNNLINKKLAKVLFQKLKKFVSSLFSRRYSLFIDFVKLASLFYKDLIDTKTFLYTISEIFKYLRKRNHGRFLVFIKEVFDFFINYKENKKSLTSKFKGTKFVLKGRVKGKTMSSKTIIQLGNIPMQTLSIPIDFASVHTFTQQFGVFGFKIWVYKC